VSHAPVLVFNLYPVFGGGFQLRKQGQGSGRPAEPRPQDLPHGAEGQMPPPLQKIDDAAVVPVIPHREEHIMAVAIAPDHDFVRAVPQNRAPSPAITFVYLIAEAGSELAQIDVPFEGIQLEIFVHDTFLSLLPDSLGIGSAVVIGRVRLRPQRAWCANCVDHT
jgi:hypothetical protein